MPCEGLRKKAVPIIDIIEKNNPSIQPTEK